MKIKALLNISSFVALGVVLVMIGSFVWSSVQTGKSNANLALALKLRQNVYERAMLRDDYFIYREARARLQWQAKSVELGALLNAAAQRFADEESRAILAEMEVSYQATLNLFRNLIENGEKAKTGGLGRTFAAEHEKRLYSQLLLRSYALGASAAELGELRIAAVLAANRFATVVLVVCILLVAATVLFNGLLISRILQIRIKQLCQGTEAIGGGNLEYRIAIGADDEIAALARATNAMAAKLKQSYTSVENLQQEVAERRQAEAAMQKASSELRLMLKNMLNAFIVWESVFDENGQYVSFRFGYFNDAYMRIAGVTQEAVSGKNVLEVWPDTEPGWVEVYGGVAVTGVPKTFDMYHAATKGWFHCNAYRPTDSPAQVCVIFEDITERKRLEQERAAMEAQMRQQQKLESIGTLASGVAHEINNPINGVMNYAQLIIDGTPATAPTVEYAREIIHETERVATIVRNLLQFSRQEKETHSPARPADIIDATLSLIRTVLRHDQITMEVDLPPGLPEFRCRSQQIQQVLMNLLTNARDALNQRYPAHHEDKLIRLTCQPFEREGRRWLRMTVADHGSGIPPELRERIFDPFFTTKSRDQGTGLGLAISHGIVKDHHGRLWFESEPGRGTQFHVELPVDNGWEL